MRPASKLEMHFYLKDGAHSMDAHTRNRCERELLAIFQELSNELRIPVKIESQAHTEGGLRDCWKFIGDNDRQITLLTSVAAIVIATLDLPDEKDDQLKALSIEEKQLIIQKLKIEVEEKELTLERAREAARLSGNTHKTRVRKSNLYREIREQEKIQKIGISTLSETNTYIGEERIVERSDFHKAILNSLNLPPIIVDNAIIEIISPVLRDGQHKWKGIYDKKTISFEMADREFRSDVLGEKISFKHGTFIEAELIISKELDEAGDIKITNHAVKTVIRKFDGSSTIETSQGKRYLANKRAAESQTDMFD